MFVIMHYALLPDPNTPGKLFSAAPQLYDRIGEDLDQRQKENKQHRSLRSLFKSALLLPLISQLFCCLTALQANLIP